MTTGRIACVGLDQAEVAVLGSLLGLMQGHLAWRWQLAASGPADLLLHNLDALVTTPLPVAGRRVGCSQRPYSHGPDVLHRPFRAAQLLRLLQALEQAAGHGADAVQSRHAAGPGTGAPATTMAYRLLAWPLEWRHWPEASWPLLAMLAAAPHTVQALRLGSGMAAPHVDRCLQRLLAAGLLAPEPVPAAASGLTMAAPAPDTASRGGWARLSARLARALGLAS